MCRRLINDVRKWMPLGFSAIAFLVVAGCFYAGTQKSPEARLQEAAPVNGEASAGSTLSGVVVGEEPKPHKRRTRAPSGAEKGTLFTNEKFIEALHTNLNVADVSAVFSYVFSNLPAEVDVYPTENYYYFSFYTSGGWYWGNIRLGVEERDRGVINFVYYEYLDDPKSPEDSATWYKRFSAADGVSVKKLSLWRYAVTYRGKEVIFNLNRIKQEPPKLFKLSKGEAFLGRTFDESGFRFFLIFSGEHSHFMWILNEEEGVPGRLKRLSDEVVFDSLSGFAFYSRKTQNRKILIGVWAQNVRRNNYWDGPFDQLSDNYVHPRLREFIQRAYPYTRGRIDKYGRFLDQEGVRVAITPYYEYESINELLEAVSDCKKQPSDEFFACITYDYKKSIE